MHGCVCGCVLPWFVVATGSYAVHVVDGCGVGVAVVMSVVVGGCGGRK